MLATLLSEERDLQILNEQVFGAGLPSFPPHLCCYCTSATGRAFVYCSATPEITSGYAVR